MDVNIDVLLAVNWLLTKLTSVPSKLDQIYIIRAGAVFNGQTLSAGVTVWDLTLGMMLMAIAFFILSKLLNGTTPEYTESDGKVRLRNRYIRYKERR